MAKNLYNPYRKVEGYNCFGCSPGNPIGLHLTFIEEGDEIISEWTPDENYTGWTDVLHGGIQATMIDEIASWVVFTKLKTAGVTREMTVKYRKSVMVSDGKVICRARLKEVNRSLATIDVQLYSKDILRAEAKCVYYVFGEEEAKNKFLYPGADAFYCQT
ncbi:MAG: hypothetical protein A2W93_14640 [Bacteroidetes bacterium GWF2_43_63]|nr:MAG: hypothetical protein A2W94_01210 [Bacteroidetes bacterium GWE2_42_42]OFY52578.1 MAG: hypothetical protein A2W93_14640 [Bacteroidetes bacterium GWF2_43_63]